MLLNPDRQIVNQDSILSGLALLLDEKRLLSVLNHEWRQHRIETLTTTYLNYKPNVRCLAGYLGQTSDGPLLLHAKAYTAEEYFRVRPITDAKDDVTPSPPCLFDDQCITVWRFPFDRKLVGLADLASPERLARWLRKRFRNEPALWGTDLETLRYKPERRYVGKLTATDRSAALIKAYDPLDFENAWRAAKTVQTWTVREPLVVSRPLGRSKGRRVIVSQWLIGQPLDKGLSGNDFTAHRLREVGAALAELHQSRRGHLAQASREGVAMAVLAAANTAAWLCPDLAQRLRRLAPRIAADLLAEHAMQCPIHGDFSADQVLVTSNGIGIIDYDQTRVGDPAADFGTFIARLERDEVCGALPAGRAEKIAEALIGGYCHHARCRQPSHIDLYVAAGLLKIAPQGFRNRLADWPAHIEGVLQRAERFFRKHSRRLRVAMPTGAGGRFGE